MFITFCLFNSSNMLTISFLNPVCPAFWLVNKRSNLSIRAFGSLGRFFKLVPLVEGWGSSSSSSSSVSSSSSSCCSLIASQIGLIIFFPFRRLTGFWVLVRFVWIIRIFWVVISISCIG